MANTLWSCHNGERSLNLLQNNQKAKPTQKRDTMKINDNFLSCSLILFATKTLKEEWCYQIDSVKLSRLHDKLTIWFCSDFTIFMEKNTRVNIQRNFQELLSFLKFIDLNVILITINFTSNLIYIINNLSIFWKYFNKRTIKLKYWNIKSNQNKYIKTFF